MNTITSVSRRFVVALFIVGAAIGGGAADASTPPSGDIQFVAERPPGLTVKEFDEMTIAFTGSDGSTPECSVISKQASDTDTTLNENEDGSDLLSRAVVVACPVTQGIEYSASVTAMTNVNPRNDVNPQTTFAINAVTCSSGVESSRSDNDIKITVSDIGPDTSCSLGLVAPLTVHLAEYAVNNTRYYVKVTGANNTTVSLTSCPSGSVSTVTDVTDTYWYCNDNSAAPYMISSTVDSTSIATLDTPKCINNDGPIFCEIQLAAGSTYPAMTDPTTTQAIATTTTTQPPATTTTTRPRGNSYGTTTTTASKNIPNIGAQHAPNTAMLGSFTLATGIGLLLWSRRRSPL